MSEYPDPEEGEAGGVDSAGGEGGAGIDDESTDSLDEETEGADTLEGDEGPAGEIPAEKLYFKIGEVARIVGVKPYVLRYWETEFSILKPGKTRSKHRLYRRRDVELLLKIKDLLHTRRFTIEGARKKLREESSSAEAAKGSLDSTVLCEIRDALVQIRDSLA